MDIISPLTDHAVVADRIRGYLAGWLHNDRTAGAMLFARLLTPWDLQLIRRARLTDQGVARVIERVLSDRKVRRMVISYEMKRQGIGRREARQEVEGFNEWAKERCRPQHAGLVSLN